MRYANWNCSCWPISLIIATVTFLFWTSSPICAGEITMEYVFARPQLQQITIAGERYYRIAMADAPNGGLPDQPALPARGARILIPAGTEVSKIEILANRLLKENGIVVCPYQSGPMMVLRKRDGEVTTQFTQEQYAFVPLIV